ncbi:YciI family protein [Pantoea sp. LMR881]|uniref:YciI family protein n=1 Tax=Pantoea sp. LMR881 TaxID=3014336 RepID=UPI003FA6CC67
MVKATQQCRQGCRFITQKDNDQPVGALWIVVAANEDEASKVFATDPFWVFGLRASVEVLSWSLAFEDMLT